jgi:predicted acetylornithine/succinylornithine family transaminase
MDYLMDTYARLPVSLVRGEGCWLWDDKGNAYLDLVAGIAVCNLGHCHPEVVKAVREQADRLFHCSNLYHIPQQETLARLLVKNAFEGQVFFCNSGAEANEGAIKLIRRSCNTKGKRGSKIITFKGSFHGRTLATVAATGQDKFRKGYDPIPEGFINVTYNDIDALAFAIDDHIGAVMLEPIQGESGINIPAPGYIRKVRELCDNHGLILAFDEVQTGLCRTGKMYAYMHEEVEPDIMTLAKGLANGFPAGAIIAKKEIASTFDPGSHASTFGGNPLAMAAGIATLAVMERDHMAQKSQTQGLYFQKRLGELKLRHASIKDVRGKGLMIGVEFEPAVDFLPKAGLEKGVMFNVIKDHVLRLVPPLIISLPEIDRAVEILDTLLKEKGL